MGANRSSVVRVVCWRHRICCQRLRACDARFVQALLRFHARHAPTTLERRANNVIFTTLGPVITAAIVLFVLMICRLSIFKHATDDFSHALKTSASCFAGGAVFACVACHLTAPGFPQPDPLDPGPDSEVGVSVRRRERIEPDGRRWTQKFCADCLLWRPLGCGHCKYCHRCILRLDHHCIFTGTCIGERNRGFFVVFLLCAGTALLHSMVGVCRCVFVIRCWTWHGRAGHGARAALLMLFDLCWTMIAGWLLLGFCVGGVVLIVAGAFFGSLWWLDVDREVAFAKLAVQHSRLRAALELQTKLCTRLVIAACWWQRAAPEIHEPRFMNNAL